MMVTIHTRDYLWLVHILTRLCILTQDEGSTKLEKCWHLELTCEQITCLGILCQIRAQSPLTFFDLQTLRYNCSGRANLGFLRLTFRRNCCRLAFWQISADTSINAVNNCVTEIHTMVTSAVNRKGSDDVIHNCMHTYLALHFVQTSGSHSLLAFRQGHLSVAHAPSTLLRAH